MQKSNTYPLKAFCPAAGFATRLRPLTDRMPKASIPVMGVPSLYFALSRLEASGIKSVAVNGHHFAEQIPRLLNNYQGNLNLHYNFEPTILGTGGALRPLQSWQQSDHLLIAIPDIITDLNIAAFVDAHFSANNFATLAIVNAHPAGKAGSVHYDSNGAIKYIGRNVRSSANIGYGIGYFILSPMINNYLPADELAPSLTAALNAAIKDGKSLGVFIHDGYFNDIGDLPQEIFNTHVSLMKDSGNLYHQLGFAELAHSQGVKLRVSGNSVLDERVRIADTAHLGKHCFLFGGVNVSPRASLENCVVAGEKTIKSSCHNRIVIDDCIVMLDR